MTDGQDGIRIWRMADRALLAYRKSAAPRTFGTEISQDGKSLVTVTRSPWSKNGLHVSILRWTEARTGKKLAERSITGTEMVYPTCFGNHPAAVSLGVKGGVTAWFLSGRTAQTHIRDDEEMMFDRNIGIVFVAEGAKGKDGHLRPWNPFFAAVGTTLRCGSIFVSSVSVHPSLNVLAVVEKGGDIVQINRRSGKRSVIGRTDIEGSISTSWSRDGQYLIVVGEKGKNQRTSGEIWRVDRGAPPIKFEAEEYGQLYGATCSPDGRTFLTIEGPSGHLRVCIRSMHDGKTVYRFPSPPRPAFQLSGSVEGRALAANSYPNLSVWNLNSASLREHVPIRDGIGERAVVSPDGKYFACYGHFSSGTVIRASDKRLVWREDSYDGWQGNPTFSPDGRRVVFAMDAGIGNGMRATKVPQARAYNVETGKLLATLGAVGFSSVSSVRYTPDGRLLLLVGVDQPIRVYNAESFALVKEIPLPAGEFRGLPRNRYFAVSKDLVALKTFEISLHVWRIRDGKHLWSRNSNDLAHTSIFLDRNSQQVLVVSEGATRAFRTADGREVKPNVPEARRATDLSLGPDRRLGIVPGNDGSVTYRDNDTGRTLVTAYVLAADEGKPVKWIAYTPDGYYQGSAGIEEHVRWRVGEKLLPGGAFVKRLRRPDVIAKRIARLLK